MARAGPRRQADAEVDPGASTEADDGVVQGAGGVVFNGQGKVLLLRHLSGSWVFPKGHIEEGEAPLDTARREIEEEAGVDARCDRQDVTYTTSYRNPRGERRRITWYRMRTDATEPVLREKLFPDGAFVPTDEALRRLTFREDRELLQRLLGSAERDGA